MRLRFTPRRPFLCCGLTGITLLAACANDFDTTRSAPPRGTVGEELFGVVCDRVGAQALHEDLTGASFKAICHKDATGAYANTVDATGLPAAVDGAIDSFGNPVTAQVQIDNRAHAVARIEALARRRGDLIAALDATFPDVTVPVKDIKNADPAHSCDAPGPGQSGERKLSDELADMLGRFTALYNDGTLPQSTESLARLFDAIKASPETQSALSRFEARQGYRPIDVALGAARPIIAYPNLRDLSNAALALLSADAKPYDPNPPKDDHGNRLPVAGPANAQFSKLLEVAHQELAYVAPDPVAAPLASPVDPASTRVVLSRPRTDLEVLQELLYAQDPAFGARDPQFIVKRDARGYAQVQLVNGAVPPPFVDADHDLMADTDDLGRFVTTDGQPPPSPFFAVGQPFGPSRDACGRVLKAGAATATGTACNAAESALYYGYLDTSHAFASSLLADLKPLTDPDPAKKHETLMYALAGSQVLFGTRGGPKVSKCYKTSATDSSQCEAGAQLDYDGFHTDNAALLDLVYAFGQLLGDPTMDDTLHYVRSLLKPDLATAPDHVADLARLAGDALRMKASADKHPEAKIPAKSTFWDEMIDTTVKIEQEPGLLEEVLRALGADATQNLGTVFANYMKFNDRITYDKTNLNGPPINVTAGGAVADMKTPVDRTKPDTGFNRSAFQRFLALIHETNGVTTCNKPGAIVDAKALGLSVRICGTADGKGALCGTPAVGFKQCEVYKIDNLASFYLDAIAGDAKGHIYFRPDTLRNGLFLGLGAATVQLIEDSSGLKGFWDKSDAKVFRPKPEWLNRLVFFDQTDTTSSPDTQKFLADLNGPNIGASSCPEVAPFDDPAPNAAEGVAPDKKVHGMHDCTSSGKWLADRGQGTIFVWEQFGFYDAIRPLLTAFTSKNREDLFVELMETIYRHWADDKGTPEECTLGVDPSVKYKECTKDGMVSYEPLLAEQFTSGILPSLHDFEKTLESTSVPHCAAVDPQTHLCTGATTPATGLSVLAAATRALLDPAKAKAAGLKDRRGVATALRNDGTTNDQVTPVYLLTGALNAMDAAFDAYDKANPGDTGRIAQWRTARSQLVDQFLSVDGSGKTSAFHDVALPKIAPQLVDILRAQLFAHCPTSFTAPFDRCSWARDDLTKQTENVVKGPVFASTVDLLDAVRKDDPTRTQMGLLMQYLLDAASKNDALPAALASLNDVLQVLKDDQNLVPLFHVLSQVVDKTVTDAQGHITQKSLVDAQLALLARMSGRAFDATGTEICANELDPNQVLTAALSHLVTPMVGKDGQAGNTPLQVIMDVVGDVNRAAPEKSDKFTAADYASISDNVSDFLVNKERGLEQFYEIVRQGTVRE